MTPESLLAHSDLIRRYAESVKAGKPIEIEHRYRTDLRHGNESWFRWYPEHHPFGFDLINNEYREKPEPREPRRWCGHVYADGTFRSCNGAYCEDPLVEVVEVIRDE